MTLLELLVQELPELGGWPKDADEAYWHAGHRLLNFYFDGGHLSNHAPIEWREKISLIGAEFEPDESDNTGQTVTREQYETALAASKQHKWNGEGLPPVGTKCEWQDKNTKAWLPVIVVYSSEWVTVIREGDKSDGVEIAIENYGDEARRQFRPTLNEADLKREEAISKMMLSSAVLVEATAGLIYDAIAAGEIPGIRLTDDTGN